MSFDHKTLAQAACQARGLAIDAVHACNSGHLGLPLGAAEMGAVLFGHALRFDPAAPRWLNRDRFILSAGHGSMFLYSWLHLAGFDLPLEEIRRFRQLHSHTPGHPEFGDTPGVEATTGPLGQGVGNAVGYAISGAMLAARFNKPDHPIFDHHVVGLAGDGCLQEGVSSEASALAAHLGLDNLILIYDSNEVTLDAMADKTQSEDSAARYRAYGWDVETIDGHDTDAFLAAFEGAKSNNNRRPKLIIARTEIGRGIPEVAGTQKAHGEAGAKFAEAARRGLGLPAETFYVSQEVRDYFAARKVERQEERGRWDQAFAEWKSAHPALAAELEDAVAKRLPDDLLDRIPPFDPEVKMATRAAGGEVLQPLAQAIPLLVGGSADLYGSTKNYIDEAGDFAAGNRSGRNIWFGIREHAMGAALNGIAYDGIFRASGATFTVFADYLRPAIRLAALARLPVLYIFTHDSVGVGEDGPTHQPVETCSGLRVIPGLDVIRPADAEETAGAFVAALERSDGPTAVLLTRQSVPMASSASVKVRREGVALGGYVLKRETAELRLILLATGSEVQHALAAAAQLGDGVRVVSMPCVERFERQPAAYQEEILPSSCHRRVSIEAGVTGLWRRWTGPQGIALGIDRFGLSAPGDEVMRELGMTADAVIAAAQRLDEAGP
ncbi:MAG TPA: transketolase [Verrucomicrobiales bacterium]|nr:transketolase [Verrucomicrobiales bacterium]